MDELVEVFILSVWIFILNSIHGQLYSWPFKHPLHSFSLHETEKSNLISSQLELWKWIINRPKMKAKVRGKVKWKLTKLHEDRQECFTQEIQNIYINSIQRFFLQMEISTLYTLWEKWNIFKFIAHWAAGTASNIHSFGVFFFIPIRIKMKTSIHSSTLPTGLVIFHQFISDFRHLMDSFWICTGEMR